MSVQHLAEYLEASAAKHPDRIAVMESSGGTASFAAINRQSDSLAAFFMTRGVGPGDRVGVVLPKSIAAVVSFFGILKAGAAYLPVDATAPVDRSRRILTDGAISAVIIHHDSSALLSAVQPADPPLRAVIVDGHAPSGHGDQITRFSDAV